MVLLERGAYWGTPDQARAASAALTVSGVTRKAMTDLNYIDCERRDIVELATYIPQSLPITRSRRDRS